MSLPYSHERQVAIDAVLSASTLARRMQGTLEALDIVNKEDLSPVTITDFSCQALINMHLLQAFPNDLIMGEEDSLFLRNPQHTTIKSKVISQIHNFYPSIEESYILDAIDRGGCQGGSKERFWVIDPIDGTRGFIRNEQYAIALALIEEGKVVLGVLGCPRLQINDHTQGGMLIAVRGQGTTVKFYDTFEEKPVHVNDKSESKEVIYCETHTTSRSHSHEEAFRIAQRVGEAKPFRLDSQCKYALVAIGAASIYFRIPIARTRQEKIWDHAPGMIVVEEAGGRVTDLRGKDLNFGLGKILSDNLGIVATNGALHEEVLAAIQQELKI